MRITAYRWAVESGANDLAAWLNRRRAVILTYHGLISAPPPEHLRPLYKIFVTAEEFRAQMALLRARYSVVPLGELVARLRAGDSGEWLAAVTFDDGWRTTRTLAAPILHELGVPATVFIATGLVGSPARGLWTQRLAAAIAASPMRELRVWGLALPLGTRGARAAAISRVSSCLKLLPTAEREEKLREVFERCGPVPELGGEMAFLSWDEVRELPSFGVACGAHTVDHVILSSLSDEDAADQIRRSRAQLEAATDRECRLFAYPNGSAKDFTEAHTKVLASAAFDGAVTQIPGRNSPLTDPFRLRRLNVGLEHTLHTFLAEVDGLRHW